MVDVVRHRGEWKEKEKEAKEKVRKMRCSLSLVASFLASSFHLISEL